MASGDGTQDRMAKPVGDRPAVRGVEVEWMLGCGNRPTIVLLLDGSLPKDLSYQKIPLNAKGRVLLFGRSAAAPEFVNYLIHDPTDPTGLYGTAVTCRLETGEEYVAKGPWCVGTCGQAYGLGDHLDVGVKGSDGILRSAQLERRFVEDAFRRFRPDLHLIEDGGAPVPSTTADGLEKPKRRGGEVSYVQGVLIDREGKSQGTLRLDDGRCVGFKMAGEDGVLGVDPGQPILLMARGMRDGQIVALAASPPKARELRTETAEKAGSAR